MADDATRAKTPKFDVHSKWLSGPEFLHKAESDWPQEPPDMSSDVGQLEEMSPRLMLTASSEYFFNFINFSSHLKMIRVMSWVLRFVKNMRLKSKPAAKYRQELTASELAHADKVICRQVQREAFANEAETLSAMKPLSKTSPIRKLTPYIDEEGLLRVHGRIDGAYCLPVSARRPIIMPQKHHVSKLIMRRCHEEKHHQNDHLIINEMRQKYWVPHAASLLKSVKRECASCIRSNAKPIPPLMGQLPADRLTPYIRPFSSTGVDYCGPFNVTIGRRHEKRWIALFTCMTTRAAHLEVAEDLSTDAFLICFRNFVNRRGMPTTIRSDNGTNFIGAQKELVAENRIFDFNHLESYMAKHNIEWLFNCPSNPSAGGCWERLVQIVKRLLQKVLKDDAPRIETFRSVIIEAENIINNRPLTDVPILPSEEEPITPNHFLVGCLNSTQIPPPLPEVVCLKKQWRIGQSIKDRLWKRWCVEYLPKLLNRPKWTDLTKPLVPGQLVVICEPNQPRSLWETARIVETFKGKDGQVRTAAVQTKRGIIRRPVTKLAALSFCEST